MRLNICQSIKSYITLKHSHEKNCVRLPPYMAKISNCMMIECFALGINALIVAERYELIYDWESNYSHQNALFIEYCSKFFSKEKARRSIRPGSQCNLISWVFRRILRLLISWHLFLISKVPFRPAPLLPSAPSQDSCAPLWWSWFSIYHRFCSAQC